MYFAGIIRICSMRKSFIFLLLISILPLQAQEILKSQSNCFDFTRLDAVVKIRPEIGEVTGELNYFFDVLQDKDTLFLDAKMMEFGDVLLNGDEVNFSANDQFLFIISDFSKSQNNRLAINYAAKPTSAMYFINWDIPSSPETRRQVWTQGQGKSNSNWIPSFDNLSEKVEFDISYDFPVGYQVIANGILKSREKLNDSLVRWSFDMAKPMSSYLIGMAAGKYSSVTRTSTSGDAMELYFLPEDESKVEPTYRFSERIFDFLETEIGIPYPWQNYKQIPVLDFLYAGMENTGATLFSSSLVVDSIAYNDRNYINVNAHELAHQWFGDYVTEKDGKDHWLHEGFASYYALLAEKEIFGSNYYYWKLYQTAEKLKELSDKGKGEALVRSGGSSLTYYEKGAWALHILREQIGDAAFKAGIKNYLQKFAYKNVSTADFLKVMRETSGEDLAQFEADWLKQSAFKADIALESLRKSTFIENYLNLAALKKYPLEEKFEYLNAALEFPVNDYLGQEVVHQIAGYNSPQAISLLKKAFNSNNLYVRQSIVMDVENIPQQLKPEFESLLNDESYLTQEATLYKLWQNFPEDRFSYLDKMRNSIGFFEKNVRMLWLTLNLVTPDYETENNSGYYKELVAYSSPVNSFEIRQNAFSYLYQIGSYSEETLLNLLDASVHPNWRFRDYARKMMDELLKDEKYKQQLIEVSEGLDERKATYLNSKIKA
ncbi:aminopeptidase [Gramella sp. AN32]|nr:aminopeptidase [Gramella sp. AN32]